MKNNNKKFHVGAKKILGIIIISSLGLFAENADAGVITKEKVIELVNKDRSSQGVGQLFENSNLSRAANDKAKDMIENKYFAHTSPSGVSPWFWFDKNEYEYKFAGENLAIDFKDAEKQQAAWMNSESHKKNILNSNYNEIGIAVREGNINGRKSIVTVQLFGSREGFVPSAIKKNEVADENENILGAQSHASSNKGGSAYELRSFWETMNLQAYEIISIALLIAFSYAGLIFLSFRKTNVARLDVRKLYAIDPKNFNSYFDFDELLSDAEGMQPVYVAGGKK